MISDLILSHEKMSYFDSFSFLRFTLFTWKKKRNSIWVFFHEHSRITGLLGKGEGISLTPRYHFHPLHRNLDINQVIAAESSPLHIASSRAQTRVSKTEYLHNYISYITDFVLFSFTPVTKLQNFNFESHLNTLIFFDQNKNDVRFEYALWKMSDFVSSLFFGFTLVIKLRNLDFEGHRNTEIFSDKKNDARVEFWICPDLV